ncbi:hypothetical protein HanIR_Chr01g0035141 [Helianthus annuus]|nr:hypothetical protein HanIR_Chr01g0035141 [Helianthus annuus]
METQVIKTKYHTHTRCVCVGDRPGEEQRGVNPSSQEQHKFSPIKAKIEWKAVHG